MSELDYNLATADDMDEVLSLYQRAVNKMLSLGIDQWDDIYPDEKQLRYDREQSQLYKVSIDGRIASTYVLNQEFDEEYHKGQWQYPHSDFTVIHRLCVNPLFQNQKVGYRTMMHIHEELRAKGTETVRLDCFTLNPYAIRLYTKLGYHMVGIARFRKGDFHLMEYKL
ncbi:GNAT family N-acetyltransferase [Spirochaeta cellobiosiphila]|uniref:GNAT family N-acetyltransferase n=1 Tax=Spirochaeta cellobiosiphila TaxID=504483 RepID=UPI0004095C3A|nr:GNAT family N-acetyltransferase [Spirochaeta cellobiosiphila]